MKQTLLSDVETCGQNVGVRLEQPIEQSEAQLREQTTLWPIHRYHHSGHRLSLADVIIREERTECRPIMSAVTVRASKLSALGRDFVRCTVLYHRTGAVHACAIADNDGILFVAEDVGRHNAFDKVAGMVLRRGMDPSDKLAFSTGRLSAEIVAKAVAHGFPLLASFSAPTATGIQWSHRFGMTLVRFLRGRRMNVYTAYHRVLPDDA